MIIFFCVKTGNRCCAKHIIKKKFFEDQLHLLRVHSMFSKLDVFEVKSLLENFSSKLDRDLFDRIPDMALNEKQLKTFHGLSWEQLIELREMLTTMRNSDKRDKTQALVVFLLKLRSGNSNNLIAGILGIDSEQRVSDYCESVLKSFKIDILPVHFGLQAVNRENLVRNHTTAIAKKLHSLDDDQLVMIYDGTYLRHQKSSNNDYQRKSYSGQKKTSLCKPFTVCMTDGYVVDILGPYNANYNDAKILEEELVKNAYLKELLQPDDVFVLDRGFRDVVPLLEEKQYQVLMPSLKGKKNQLSTKESNHSRRVTKVRWPIEAVHGIIGQKYKLLHHQFDNKMLPNAQAYCKIACFLNNKFGKRLNSDAEMTDEIVNRMMQCEKENTLAQEVEDGRWSRRKKDFKSITSEDLLDFPEMTIKDLKLFFTGTYQLKQSLSYLAEMIDDRGCFDLSYHESMPEIIKFKVSIQCKKK